MSNFLVCCTNVLNGRFIFFWLLTFFGSHLDNGEYKKTRPGDTETGDEEGLRLMPSCREEVVSITNMFIPELPDQAE